MAGNHLEDLVAEWYEWNGFFVRRNVQVGKRAVGGFESELDVVAFHPVKKQLVQIEPSLDADSWGKREERYLKEFQAGRKYVPVLFAGLEVPAEIEQVAIFLFAGREPPDEIGGGKIFAFPTFMNEILKTVRTRPLNNAMIPEQYALLRTLQFAARTWPIGSAPKNRFSPVLSLSSLQVRIRHLFDSSNPICVVNRQRPGISRRSNPVRQQAGREA